MTPVVILAAALLLVVVPVVLVNWDVIRRRTRRRRQRRNSNLPFLFFPTTGKPIVPAWHGTGAPARSSQRPVAGDDAGYPLRPEPGIADLPSAPAPTDLGHADPPSRETGLHAKSGRTVEDEPPRRPSDVPKSRRKTEDGGG